MKQRTLDALADMRMFAQASCDLVGQFRSEDWQNSTVHQFAVERTLHLVGEAAGRVSKEEREQIADIPWERILGLRQHLVHGYDRLNYPLLARVIDEELPNLIRTIDTILKGSRP